MIQGLLALWGQMAWLAACCSVNGTACAASGKASRFLPPAGSVIVVSLVLYPSVGMRAGVVQAPP
jgi:hypothetical protein